MTSLTINGVLTEGDVVITTGGTPPPPKPPEPPTPPPSGDLLFPGWSLNLNPSALPGAIGRGLFDVNTTLLYKFESPLNYVNCHAITLNGMAFPTNGAAIVISNSTTNANRRDVWISDTPGGTTVNGKPLPPTAKSFGSDFSGNLYLSFVASPYACEITKGQTYYLNAKASDRDTMMDYILQAGAM